MTRIPVKKSRNRRASRKKESDSLTENQLKFVEVFDGDATKAAMLAGYAGPKSNWKNVGYKLMRDMNVRMAIMERNRKGNENTIATREDRQRFWTTIMLDPREDIKDRLKASELLGRSEADFTDKIEVDVKSRLENIIMASIDPPQLPAKASEEVVDAEIVEEESNVGDS